jgi:hypothetical protein
MRSRLLLSGDATVRQQSDEHCDVSAASSYVFLRGVHRPAVLKGLPAGPPKGIDPTIEEEFYLLFLSPP